MGLFVWYFGTDRRYRDVAHHTILLGPRYRGLLEDIFDRKVLADDFSLYLHRPTATDPSLAPAGLRRLLRALAGAASRGGTDWATQAEPYRQRDRGACSRRPCCPSSSSTIVTSRVMTPLDFRDRLLSPSAAPAFGLEPVLLQSAWFRPHNRSEDIDGLYLVGAGTHPGAGVPGVLSSARVLDTWCRMHTSWPDAEGAAADIAACRALLRGGSRSFFAASLLLPRRCAIRPWRSMPSAARPTTPIDLDADQATALGRLRERLDTRLGAARWPIAADRAFADVVERFAIPRATARSSAEGFAWDAEGRRYEKLAGLHAYAVRVAGTVGAMMAMLMGVRDPEVLARACDLGVAMQLSNIARDVGEDARNGRLYLPLGWLTA